VPMVLYALIIFLTFQPASYFHCSKHKLKETLPRRVFPLIINRYIWINKYKSVAKLILDSPKIY